MTVLSNPKSSTEPKLRITGLESVVNPFSGVVYDYMNSISETLC